MPVWGNRWFYRIIRANSHPMEEVAAERYKKKLSWIYVIASGCLFITLKIMNDKDKQIKREKYGEIDNARYWAQFLGFNEAKIVRVNGVSSYSIEDYDFEKVKIEEEAERLS